MTHYRICITNFSVRLRDKNPRKSFNFILNSLGETTKQKKEEQRSNII
jgi:hypothetical protein